jgi:hypothetical protein
MDWLLLGKLLLVGGLCFVWGYFQARDTYYEKGYHEALEDIKGNNEDFDHIAGGG